MSDINTHTSPEHAALLGSTTDPNSILSGATAHTGGFVEPAPTATSGFGGGLASSPNVPAPGTSINPATGLPHTAGLTRAELEAKKAAAAAEPSSLLGGATAHTSGFVEPSPQSGFGGGLASSPNVPAPGTSINPATGLPHTAGLTRAELEAKKAATASTASGASLEDLSGREQAARQLAGVGAAVNVGSKGKELSGGEQAARQLAGLSVTGNVPEVDTPGHELPGGWGPIKPVAAPGTGPNATSSIYEDVAVGLEKVGNAAYAAIPAPIKDALSSHHTTTGTANNGERRGSIAGMLEQAKNQAKSVVHSVEEKLSNSTHTGLEGKSSAARTAGTAGSEGSVLHQVKGLFEALAGVPPAAASHIGEPVTGHTAGSTTGHSTVGSGGHSTAVAPATSLPSNETTGALPGQHSSGAGALPGTAGETGVAVLPLEKENQHILPGEVPVRAGNLSDSAPSSTSGPAATSVPATSSSTAASAPTTSTANAVTSTPTSSGVDYSHLAPALPQTNLGLGADHGATDVGLTKSSDKPMHDAAAAAVTGGAIGVGAGTAAVLAHHSAGSEVPSGNARDTRQSADRTTSTASITAIRGGQEGVNPSSGPGVSIPSSISEVSGAKSLTPGNEGEGVGHPSTRGLEGTSRQPGTYPTADHAGTTSSVDGAANHNVESSTLGAAGVGAGLGAGAGAAAAAASGGGTGTGKGFLDTTDDTIGLPPTVKMTGGAKGVGHADHLDHPTTGATSGIAGVGAGSAVGSSIGHSTSSTSAQTGTAGTAGTAGLTSAGVGRDTTGTGLSSTGSGLTSAGTGLTSAGIVHASTGSGATSTGTGHTAAGTGLAGAGTGLASTGAGHNTTGTGLNSGTDHPSTLTADGKPFPSTLDDTIGLPPTVKMTGGATGVGHADHLTDHHGVTTGTTGASGVTGVDHGETRGHQRTGSNASDKKKGLFSKIKEKIKHHN